jgi:hypothetical protein
VSREDLEELRRKLSRLRDELAAVTDPDENDDSTEEVPPDLLALALAMDTIPEGHVMTPRQAQELREDIEARKARDRRLRKRFGQED